MTTNLTKRLLFAVALTAAAAGAQATGLSQAGPRDPYTEGSHSVQEPRSLYNDGARSVDPYTDGARIVEPYTDGARNVDPHFDGAHTLAGLDRSGVSADPARSVDPYLDGANA